MTRAAFLGLGEMGGPMATHAICAGHDVTLYDPRSEAVDARMQGSARRAASAADAADGADVVCVVVRDDAQAIESVTGTGGVLAGATTGTVVVLHATVAPATVETLADSCAARGVRFVDAGVSGGASGAEDGTLYVMCGGDPAVITEVRPVLDAYAAHVVRFGEVGAGMAAKLARNFMQYQVWVGAFEAMALADAAGLDLRAFEHLCRESGITRAFEYQLTKPTTDPIDPSEHLDQAAWLRKTIELGWKDLDDVLALARAAGRPHLAETVAVTRRAYGPSMGLDVRPPDDPRR